MPNMRRYTAQVRGGNEKRSGEQIKKAIEQALLTAARPITFSFGAIGPGGEGQTLVELANEMKRQDLLLVLRGIEEGSSLRVEGIGWGWPLSGAAGGRIASAEGKSVSDPYQLTEAQQVEERTYAFGNREAVRLVYSAGIVAVFLFFVLATLPSVPLVRFLRDLSSSVYLLILIFLVMSIVNVPVLPFVYVSYARCHPGGLEIKCWLKRPILVDWTRMWGMDVGYSVCEVRTDSVSLSLPRRGLPGATDESTFIKTILQRASLNFVESVVGSAAIYRRFDAKG